MNVPPLVLPPNLVAIAHKLPEVVSVFPHNPLAQEDEAKPTQLPTSAFLSLITDRTLVGNVVPVGVIDINNEVGPVKTLFVSIAKSFLTLPLKAQEAPLFYAPPLVTRQQPKLSRAANFLVARKLTSATTLAAKFANPAIALASLETAPVNVLPLVLNPELTVVLNLVPIPVILLRVVPTVLVPVPVVLKVVRVVVPLVLAVADLVSPVPVMVRLVEVPVVVVLAPVVLKVVRKAVTREATLLPAVSPPTRLRKPLTLLLQLP